MTLPSNEVVPAATEAGARPSALLEHVARLALATARPVRVAYDLPEWPFRLLRHRERYRSRAAEAFVTGLG